MLPPADVAAYVDLQPLQRLGLDTGRLAAARAPEYAQFVQETGFDFERDLRSVALALNGAPGHPEETTAVLDGRFGAGFERYLRQHARARRQVDGLAVYAFPGWAQPQRAMEVAMPGPHYVIASNAADFGAVLRRARAWWPRGAGMWQTPWWRLAPVAYAAANVESLAAMRALDGTSPPWRGGGQFTASLRATAAGGAALEADAGFDSASDAAAAAAWVRQQVAGLAPAAAAAPDGVAAVLSRATVAQSGARVTVRLTVDGATLRSWRF